MLMLQGILTARDQEGIKDLFSVNGNDERDRRIDGLEEEVEMLKTEIVAFKIQMKELISSLTDKVDGKQRSIKRTTRHGHVNQDAEDEDQDESEDDQVTEAMEAETT